MAFLGPTLIIAEFAFGVLLSIALGTFILLRAHSFLQYVLGFYFVSLGLNYMPMLLYALQFKNRENAHAEIADELNDKPGAMARYRRQSIFLLVPLVVPLVALRSRKRNPAPAQ